MFLRSLTLMTIPCQWSTSVSLKPHSKNDSATTRSRSITSVTKMKQNFPNNIGNSNAKTKTQPYRGKSSDELVDSNEPRWNATFAWMRSLKSLQISVTSWTRDLNWYLNVDMSTSTLSPCLTAKTEMTSVLTNEDNTLYNWRLTQRMSFCNFFKIWLKTAWNGTKLRVSENKNSSLLLIDKLQIQLA